MTVTQDGLVHGFVGYFDSDLHNDVAISESQTTHCIPPSFSFCGEVREGGGREGGRYKSVPGGNYKIMIS